MKQFTFKQLNLKYSLALIFSISLNNVLLEAAKTATPAAASTSAAPLDPKKLGTVEEVSSLNQFLKILQDPNRPVIIAKFYAPWCGHCKKMGPIFEQQAKDYPDVKFLAVDTTVQKELGAKYNINGIPQFRVFKPGKDQFEEDDKIEGANEDLLVEKIEKHSKRKPTPAQLEARRWNKMENKINGLEQTIRQVIQAVQQMQQEIQQLKAANGQSTGQEANKGAAKPAEPADPNVTNVTSQDQLDGLKKDNNVVLGLYSKTCPHCVTAKPKFAELAKKHKGSKKVKFAKVNHDEAPEVFSNLGVQSAPTHAVFKKNSTEQPQILSGGDKFDELETAVNNLN